MSADDLSDHARAARRYDRRVARWRALVDWAKHRPWALKLISPMSRGKGRWRFVDRLFDRAIVPPKPDFSNWESHTFAACWIGHATMLLRIGGMTILTDPVFSSRVGLGWGFGTFGPARLIAPACAVSDLPKVDLILISHAHFDHLDRPTLAKLPKTSTVVCARGTRDLIDDLGFADVIELESGDIFDMASYNSSSLAGEAGWGGERQVASIGFRFTPPPPAPPARGGESDKSQTKSCGIMALAQRHWGARVVLDKHRSYCAFLIESPDGKRILFGGDTAYQELWKPIGDSAGVDLAIMGIGAYDPWIEGHANPEQAWQMAMHAGARKVVPMHHSSFKLSAEPMQEPLSRFLITAGERVGDVVCRSMGEIWSDDQ